MYNIITLEGESVTKNHVQNFEFIRHLKQEKVSKRNRPFYYIN